jgi:hypothetical protein
MIQSKQKILSFRHVRRGRHLVLALSLALLTAATCWGSESFRNASFDFGSVQTAGVMPLANMSRDSLSSDRIRDVFMNSLLAEGGIYVIPPGEMARGIISVGVANPSAPTPEEVIKICRQLKIDAVFTGSVREYGEVRSGSAMANIISLSMQMFEGQTGKIVWSAATTQGGIGMTDRLFGGGGESMNVVTAKAVNDLISNLYK